jgi:hypothetical protein
MKKMERIGDACALEKNGVAVYIVAKFSDWRLASVLSALCC